MAVFSFRSTAFCLKAKVTQKGDDSWQLLKIKDITH